MTNTLLNILYKVKIPQNVITVKQNANVAIEMIKKNANAIDYTYSTENTNPYGLNEYFNGIKRSDTIKIYTSKIDNQPNINNVSNSLSNNKYKVTKIMSIVDSQKTTENYNYIMNYPTHSAISGASNQAEASKIALLLGKVTRSNGGYTKVDSNDNNTILSDGFARYVPTRDEMIALNALLLVELNGKAGRSDLMWQREKAVILWCFINQIAMQSNIKDRKQKVNENPIIGLFPKQGDKTYFVGYLNNNQIYQNMFNTVANTEIIGKYNSAEAGNKSNEKYNFELFIDAFFKGYFPEETLLTGYSNWSHISGLSKLSGFHLSTADGEVLNIKETSLGKVYSLDGNSIITKNGKIPNDRK